MKKENLQFSKTKTPCGVRGVLLYFLLIKRLLARLLLISTSLQLLLLNLSTKYVSSGYRLQIWFSSFCQFCIEHQRKVSATNQSELSNSLVISLLRVSHNALQRYTKYYDLQFLSVYLFQTYIIFKVRSTRTLLIIANALFQNALKSLFSKVIFYISRKIKDLLQHTKTLCQKSIIKYNLFVKRFSILKNVAYIQRSEKNYPSIFNMGITSNLYG